MTQQAGKQEEREIDFKRSIGAHILVLMVLVCINVLAARLNSFAGVVVLPFTIWAFGFLLIRLAAPWMIKARVKKFLAARGGEAPYEQVLENVAGAGEHPMIQEDNRKVIQAVLKEMADNLDIVISNGIVRKVG